MTVFDGSVKVGGRGYFIETRFGRAGKDILFGKRLYEGLYPVPGFREFQPSGVVFGQKNAITAGFKTRNSS